MKIHGPLFIVGMGRTGSKMLRRFINENTNYYLITEIHYINPIYRSFKRIVKKKIGRIKNENVELLVNMFYNGSFYGQFWNELKEKENSEFLGKKILIKLIKSSDKSLKEIFRILLEQSALEHSKNGYGAKSPVFIGNSKILLKWFPNCKIIHLTRDPRAIASSYLKKREFLKIASAKVKIFDEKSRFLKFIILSYVALTYRLTGHVHKKLKKYENYRLIKYEELVLERERTIEQLNKFINVNIPLTAELPKKTLNDSYTDIKDKIKLNKDTAYDIVNRWKKFLSKKEKKYIWFLTKRTAKNFGYH